MRDALNAWGRLGTFQQVTPKSARTQPGEPVLARFEGWHQRRPPAVRFGRFVSFRVWSSVQPQNIATQYFGSFKNLGRQTTSFKPRGTRRIAAERQSRCASLPVGPRADEEIAREQSHEAVISNGIVALSLALGRLPLSRRQMRH